MPLILKPKHRIKNIKKTVLFYTARESRKAQFFLVTEHFSTEVKPLHLHSSKNSFINCYIYFNFTYKSTQTTKGGGFGRWTEIKTRFTPQSNINLHLAMYVM